MTTSTPRTKSDRRSSHALRAFARFVYTTVNRHARRIDLLTEQNNVLRDRLDELADQLIQLRLELADRDGGVDRD